MTKKDFDYREYHKANNIYFVTVTRKEYLALLRAKQELDTIKKGKRASWKESVSQWWNWLKN